MSSKLGKGRGGGAAAAALLLLLLFLSQGEGEEPLRLSCWCDEEAKAAGRAPSVVGVVEGLNSGGCEWRC